MCAVQIWFWRRRLTWHWRKPRFRVLLFTQAVFLDFSEAVSNLVFTLLTCDASGSQCDSDACCDSCALQAPWIRFSCDHLPSHSAEAVPNITNNCWDASPGVLEWGVVLFLLSSSLGPLNFPTAWQNMGPSNKEGRKERAQNSLGNIECISMYSSWHCHESERKGYNLI